MASATLAPDRIAQDEQRLVLREISWESYVTIADALPGRRNLRMIYVDGSLTFLTKSRLHDWFAERLGEFVKTVAQECEMRLGDGRRCYVSFREKNHGCRG